MPSLISCLNSVFAIEPRCRFQITADSFGCSIIDLTVAGETYFSYEIL
jgi:hypothetical protein